jgi:hypothetical protein
MGVLDPLTKKPLDPNAAATGNGSLSPTAPGEMFNNAVPPPAAPGNGAFTNSSPDVGPGMIDPTGTNTPKPPASAPAAPVAAPPPAAAPLTMPPGATDMGNNLVKLANGQMVPRDHPIFLAALAAAQAAAAPAAGAPVSGNGGAAAPITTAGQVTGTTANVGATAAQGAPTTVAQSYQQALVNRLNPTPVGTSSPEVAPAIEANKLAEQRGMERNRAMLAERAAANGQNLSGGFETNLMGLAQDRAGREGQFNGAAVQHANDLQNENMTNATSQIGNLLTGNANRDQNASQFGQDLNLRQQALDQSGQLGNSDIALRGRLGDGQLNLGLLQSLLQNNQFGQSLAQNGAQFGSSLDQNAILALLGGL